MKQKVVTAKITMTKVACTTYHKEAGIASTTVTLPATFKTEAGLEKAVREYLRHDDLSLVNIDESYKVQGVYEMNIEKFINEADKYSEIVEQ